MPTWWARSRIVPEVLRLRNTAPWVRKIATNVSPPSSENGLSRLKNPPSYSTLPFSSLSGTPRTMLANATPHSSAGIAEPTTMAASQRARHEPPERLLRYSKATPRRISPTRMRNSGR